MAEPKELIEVREYGVRRKRFGIVIRGYVKDTKGGLYTPVKARAIARYLLALADAAERLNGQREAEEKEGTSQSGSKLGKCGHSCNC